MQEIILILVLGLLIFGPKKIPEIARSLGKGFREFKQSTSGIMDSLNEEIKKPVPPPKTLPPASGPPRAETGTRPPEDVEEVVINLEDEGQKD